MNPITDPSSPPVAPQPGAGNGPAPFPADLVPALDHLVTKDDAPVDNLFAEKQQRLLTEPLNSNWPGPGGQRPFLMMSNVGLFFEPKNPALVPDAMLSIDVQPGDNLLLKENHSYYVWLYGKPPDVVIELVSDRLGGEDSYKLQAYARMGIPYCVIYDPLNYLRAGDLRIYGLHQAEYRLQPEAWFPHVGLGLRLWQGSFERCPGTWLRWCDQAGNVIPTGQEAQEQERQRAEKLRAQLRALGVDPEA